MPQPYRKAQGYASASRIAAAPLHGVLSILFGKLEARSVYALLPNWAAISEGLKTPRSVMMPAMSSAGVTSKAGL